MATVRLFAGLREIAGTSRVQVEGSTVGEVVETAARQMGPQFRAAVATARIWRNGEAAEMHDGVGPDDELAILPPVSGGAVAAVRSAPELRLLYPVAVAVLLVVVNIMASDAMWAAVMVGVVGLWVVDIAIQMEWRGRPLPAIGVFVGVVSGAVLAHVVGASGMTLAIALSVAAVLAFGIGADGYRSVDSIAPGVLVAVIASAAVASLVLTRSTVSPDAQAIDVFLAVVIIATLGGLAVDALSDLPYLDPYTVTALVAVVASLVMAFFWGLDIAGYLLVGLGVAVALVAGRGLGSMLRSGQVSLVDRPPGALSVLDGAVLSAAIYFPLLRLVL